MNFSELSIRFCGIAGDGVVSSGKILAGACADIGLEVMVNDIFSAEIRGKGKSTTTVRFGNSKVLSMGDGIDLLIGMAAKESISELKDVKEHMGGVLYESSTPHDVEEEDSLVSHIPSVVQGYGIPLKKIANKASGTNRGRNIVAIGAMCYIYSLPPDMFIHQIQKVFGKKAQKVIDSNVSAFQLGYDYCKEHFQLDFKFNVKNGGSPKKLASGNDAIFQGALDCGLKFFAGYPITPATKIMEIASKELAKHDGWTIQVEDEIAAVSAIVGGGYAGKRSMTATSGPGLAFMTGMIGLAVMAEIPIVIINVQRGGPSTGLPTKVEQGDLNLALYGGAGDAPRVVMAPSNSEECYSGIQLAFDLAEEYQTPVIFLSDLFLGQRLETAAIEEKVDRDRCTRKRPTPGQLKNYMRFQDTDDGVSPLLVPGEEGAYYTITGLEHTERGNPNYEAGNHTMMTAKRFRKFESMVKDLPPAEVRGDEDAQIGFVSWGSTVGAVLEGMELARKEEGIKSKLIYSMMIQPQREDTFREFFASCKRIIVPEMNYQGQYAALLKSRYLIEVIEIHIPAVEPVSPRKIAQKIKEVNNELSGLSQ
ncbi:MAG: 2-oxoacid:acceptor oxidoreductase subunit alpha [bacterium]|nr:2-oxoacid:acceptor oxidoreductase subunit alpha [bacterium]